MKLLHNRVEPTHLMSVCTFEIVPEEVLFKTPVYTGAKRLFPSSTCPVQSI